jgi:hypothetical protein
LQEALNTGSEEASNVQAALPSDGSRAENQVSDIAAP